MDREAPPAGRSGAQIAGDPFAPRNLVFVCDGTLTSIRAGEESNVGLVRRLLTEVGQSPAQRWKYDRGVQGKGWRRWYNAASGEGVNLSIMRGYSFIARHYRPGDRIYLLGYSRGAYAARSLAGMIGRIGILRHRYATERYVNLAFRFYQVGSRSAACRHFTAHRCHEGAQIEMLGVWDTVKALGLPYPVLSRLAPMATDFHDAGLGPHVRHGYHALAIDETRTAYRPKLWERSEHGRLEQVWFPGAHADVGGAVRLRPEARPLANIPLCWMLRRAARHGLVLPEGWEERFPEDAAAPMHDNRIGLAKYFLLRSPRSVGMTDGELIHPSVRQRTSLVPGYKPRADMGEEPPAGTGGEDLIPSRSA